MCGKTVKEIKLGEKASLTKIVSWRDISEYSGISGDYNPLHVNHEYAKKTRFGNVIAHGAISVALVYGVWSMVLPGPGTLAKEVTAKYLHPVYIGDKITAEVEVTEIDVEKNTVKLKFICINQDGVKVVEGVGVMMPQPEKLRGG